MWLNFLKNYTEQHYDAAKEILVEGSKRPATPTDAPNLDTASE